MIHLHLLLIRFSLGAAIALGVTACQDASDPTALLMGEDAHPAVQLAAELPSLPGLAGRGAVEGRIPGAIDAWIGSWGLPAEQGDTRRSAAYAAAAGPLAEALGAEGVAEAFRRLEVALAGAGRLDPHALPKAVAQRVADARQEADAARSALDRGALQVGVRATLHGADLLRGVGPEGVARTLIARAEAGMEWAGSPADPLAIQRAERLLYGAWDAVAEAEFGIAIQRAYYACQLLGVPLQ